MDPFQLTRALIDIDSVTPNEEKVGQFLFDHLRDLAARTGGRVEKFEVEPHRYNVLAHWGDPRGHALHAYGHRAAVLLFA